MLVKRSVCDGTETCGVRFFIGIKLGDEPSEFPLSRDAFVFSGRFGVTRILKWPGRETANFGDASIRAPVELGEHLQQTFFVQAEPLSWIILWRFVSPG